MVVRGPPGTQPAVCQAGMRTRTWRTYWSARTGRSVERGFQFG